MKTLRDFRDLREYGIDCLTGEACNISTRILCDLSEMGCKRIREFFGLPYDAKLAGSWNSGMGNPTGESVGSVMLPYGCFQELAAFLLLSGHYVKAVATKNGLVIGISHQDIEEHDDEDDALDGLNVILDRIDHFYGISRRYSPLNVPHQGLSNVHQMSGRTA